MGLMMLIWKRRIYVGIIFSLNMHLRANTYFSMARALSNLGSPVSLELWYAWSQRAWRCADEI
jgi:hypothetical protein